MGLNGLFAFYYDCHGDYKAEKQSIHSGINQILWKVEFSQNFKSLICSKALLPRSITVVYTAMQFSFQGLFNTSTLAGGGTGRLERRCAFIEIPQIFQTQPSSLPFALIFLGLKPSVFDLYGICDGSKLQLPPNNFWLLRWNVDKFCHFCTICSPHTSTTNMCIYD